MDFASVSDFFNNHAETISRAFGKPYGLMHPAMRLTESDNSRLRSRFGLEELVCKVIESQQARRVLDLGCGYCASMLYLSNICTETVFAGICASESEIMVSRNIIREADKIKNILVFKGDFLESNNFRVFPRQNLAYAIDSFRYVSSLSRFFENIYDVLEPGASLFIIDFFRMDTRLSEKKFAQSLFNRLVNIGRLSRVWGIEECRVAARDAGFAVMRDDDLTLRIRRPWQKVIFDWIRRFTMGIINQGLGQTLQGTDLLEHGFSKGILGYHIMEFKRV